MATVTKANPDLHVEISNDRVHLHLSRGNLAVGHHNVDAKSYKKIKKFIGAKHEHKFGTEKNYRCVTVYAEVTFYPLDN